MRKIKHIPFFLLVMTVFQVDAQGIHRSTCNGNYARVDSLLTSHPVNVRDSLQRTPLLYAVGCRRDSLVKMLLERGAAVNVRDTNGLTPILMAARVNNDEYVDALFKKNVDPNVVTNNGDTPQHWAAIHGNLSMMKLLVNNKTNLNQKNERGSTPLEIALRLEYQDIAEFLVEKGADESLVRTFEFSGPYVGQPLPGLEAEAFAPNFISTENMEHTASFTPDGKKMYYTLESRAKGAIIMVTELKDGVWTTPRASSIEGDYREIDPFVTHDGSALYYTSNRPVKEGDTLDDNFDIWRVKREGDRWGKPEHMGANVSSEHPEWFPTLTKTGKMYFTWGGRNSNIAYSELKDGVYGKPIELPETVNSEQRDYDPVIDPNERFVIWSSNRDGGFGGSDLYISFKNEDGTWAPAKNMGEAINTRRGELAPSISHDGKYFFFCRAGDIYWIDMKIIDKLEKL